VPTAIGIQLHGSNSSNRLILWSRMSARYACGSRQLSMTGSMMIIARARVSEHLSVHSNSQFFLPMPIGRSARSSGLLSMATRPSLRNKLKPSLRLSQSLMALARLLLAGMRRSCCPDQQKKAAPYGGGQRAGHPSLDQCRRACRSGRAPRGQFRIWLKTKNHGRCTQQAASRKRGTLPD
jgi:hypothetical protein